MLDTRDLLPLLSEVFTRQEAAVVGVSGKVLRRLTVTGEIVRMRRGTYRKLDQSRTPTSQASPVGRTSAEAKQRDAEYRGRIRAAALQLGPAYAVSHLSAAALYRLPLPLGDPGQVHLTRLRPCHRSRSASGAVVLHHADSSRTPVDVRSGVVLTSIDRTLADCLRTLPVTKSVPIADRALHLGLTTTAALAAYLEVERRWVGMPRARMGLTLTDGRRETWLESFSFVRLDQLGVPMPTPQVTVLDERGRFVGRVDGVWEDTATVAEADGHGKYLDAAGGDAQSAANAVVTEKLREDDLRGLGLSLIRWDLDDLRRDPAQLVSRIDRARAAGDRRRFRGHFTFLPRP